MVAEHAVDTKAYDLSSQAVLAQENSVHQVQLMPVHPKMGTQFAWPMPMTKGAAGWDLCAAIDAAKVLEPGARMLVPCGFALALPHGLEGQVRPRSGLAMRHGISVLNAPGTIDSDYRGEVKVVLIHLGEEAYTIEPGARIAQLVIAALPQVAVETVASLSATSRGGQGFGSTGA